MKTYITLLMSLFLCLACTDRKEVKWVELKKQLESASVEEITIVKYETRWDIEANYQQAPNSQYKVAIKSKDDAQKIIHDLQRLSIAYKIEPARKLSGAIFTLSFLFFCIAWPFLIAIAIYHLLVRNQLIDRIDKLIWAATILLLPYLGSILYLLFGRKSSLHGGSAA